MTDRELLAAFVEQGSQEALADLFQRHTGMVHGVCCRILKDKHGAEDVVQATFLILVRKSKTLWHASGRLATAAYSEGKRLKR